jgi:hypothetical protein
MRPEMDIEKMNIEGNLLITPETLIGDLLDKYPHLEEELIRIAPVFSKLKNPVLRKTIARVTSIRQAAAVGNVNLSDMVNTLRRSAGQEQLTSEPLENWSTETGAFRANQNVKQIYDARDDLNNGVHPVARVMTDLSKLEYGEKYLLITPFVPAPLIDKAKIKGFKTETVKIAEDKFETYFLR